MDKRLIYRFAAAFVAMLLLAFPVSGQTPEPSKVPAVPAVPAAPAVPVGPVPAGPESTARVGVRDRPIAADSLERIDPVDTDLVALRRSAKDGEMVLEVAGFGITLSNSPDGWFRSADSVQNRSRVSLVFLGGTEYGFIVPTGLGYGAYPAGSDHFFDLRNGKSFHCSTTLVGLNVAFGRQRQFDLKTGLRYTIDNYRLSDNSITLGNENGMVVPVALDEKADKSKLRITSLGIPLHLAYHPVKQMTLSLSGYFDFTMGANSIYKNPKVKNPLSGVRTFQFGVGVGVTYYRCGVYFRYGVTPLFENGVGPKVHPLSLGICFGL